MAKGFMARFLRPKDVVNNLSSTSTTAPLAANQGKVLNDAIGALFSGIVGIKVFDSGGIRKVAFMLDSINSSVVLGFGKLNANQNYMQVWVNDVDKGYIIFDVSRNV